MSNAASYGFLRMPHARLLIVSACSASKRFNPADQPTELELDDSAQRVKAEARLARHRLPAAEMYTGNGHGYVREGIKAMRDQGCFVSHLILSAGYGLVKETDCIAPYNVTFSGVSKKRIEERGRRLKLREQLVANAKGHDQVVIILGREYLIAIGLPLPVDLLPPTLVYVAPSLRSRLGEAVDTTVVGEEERQKMRAYSSSAKEKRFKLDVWEALSLEHRDKR